MMQKRLDDSKKTREKNESETNALCAAIGESAKKEWLIPLDLSKPGARYWERVPIAKPSPVELASQLEQRGASHWIAPAWMRLCELLILQGFDLTGAPLDDIALANKLDHPNMNDDAPLEILPASNKSSETLQIMATVKDSNGHCCYIVVIKDSANKLDTPVARAIGALLTARAEQDNRLDKVRALVLHKCTATAFFQKKMCDEFPVLQLDLWHYDLLSFDWLRHACQPQMNVIDAESSDALLLKHYWKLDQLAQLQPGSKIAKYMGITHSKQLLHSQRMSPHPCAYLRASSDTLLQ